MHPMELRLEIKEAYIAGKYGSLSELARAFKLTPSTVEKWRDDENWSGLRRTYMAARDQTLPERLLARLGLSAGVINEKHYRLHEALGGLVSRRIRQLAEDSEPIPENGDESEQARTVAKLNAVELQALASTIERIQKGQRLAADMATENEEHHHKVEFPDFRADLRSALDSGDLLRVEPELPEVVETEPET